MYDFFFTVSISGIKSLKSAMTIPVGRRLGPPSPCSIGRLSLLTQEAEATFPDGLSRRPSPDQSLVERELRSAGRVAPTRCAHPSPEIGREGHQPDRSRPRGMVATHDCVSTYRRGRGKRQSPNRIFMDCRVRVVNRTFTSRKLSYDEPGGIAEIRAVLIHALTQQASSGVSRQRRALRAKRDGGARCSCSRRIS
jgi:hypothetical protein